MKRIPLLFILLLLPVSAFAESAGPVSPSLETAEASRRILLFPIAGLSDSLKPDSVNPPLEKTTEAWQESDDPQVKVIRKELRDTFQLHPGSLRKQLSDWAVLNGYQLQWKGDYDIIVDTESSFDGTLIDAVNVVVKSLRDTGTAISATIYNRSKVIVIRGDL